jgi:hypothetical protein
VSETLFVQMTLNRWVAPLALLALLGACATARVVTVQPGRGGVIAIAPANDPEARQKADVIMKQNCGEKKVEIVEEGEAVVGQTISNSSTGNVAGGSIYSSGTSYASNQTEWRITYKCL